MLGRSIVFCFLCVIQLPVLAIDRETQLRQLRARIETLQENLNQTRSQRDVVREEMRGLEQRIGALVNTLRTTDAQLATEAESIRQLQARATRERQNLQAQQQGLAKQLRAAYAMGRQEYAKMLLNQENPAVLARVVTYYDYLNRARTERIVSINLSLEQLHGLEQKIAERTRELSALRQTQRQQKDALETSRARRGVLLASLDHQVHDQSQRIERLQADEKRLEALLSELKTALTTLSPSFPAGASMAKYQGRLSLPARGRIVARYGEQKNIGNLKWRGLLIAGQEGQNVVSVFRGRVAYADWLRGFGLLLILDHGDGYMSLYGYNQSLHKQVGDWVEAGEIIASLGNTGDTAQSGLYFEIRHRGEPRDPLMWCKVR